MFRLAFAVITCVVCPLSLVDGAERTDRSLLTLERIYAKREFQSESLSAEWLSDTTYTTVEKSASDECRVVAHDALTGEQTVLVPASRLVPSLESLPLKVEGYAFSDDRSRVLISTNTQRVWRRKTRGDYWILDRTSHELKKLGGDAAPATLQFAKFSPDADRVAYVRERNIYVEDLRSGQITPLTSTANHRVINGTFDWVYEEELKLRDGFRWSPDGDSIAFWQVNTDGVDEFPLVDNTAGIYPQVRWFAYPKTGRKNPSCRIGVVNVVSRDVTWMKIPGDPRDHYIARMEWAGNSNELIVQQLNRLQNTNRVMLVDVKTRNAKTILTETDEAWVDVHDELHWLSNGQQFTWISERDGWRHAYLVSRDGKMVRLLTPGEFDVIRLLSVDDERQRVYFIASPDSATQRFLYSVKLNGSEMQRLTPDGLTGTHSYEISPAGSLALHTESDFDTPPTADLVSLPDHKRIRRLLKNRKLRRKVARLERSPVEFLRVDIGNDVVLDGWCLKPADFDASKTYPLLVYVYGEPAGQTVLDRWGGDQSLWHLMLAQQGYVVMSFDNRGTAAPRGRQWRKCVYRQIGTLGPQDQADALRRLLESRPYLDAERVGIWGWSGGGSSALHAIFRYPDLYGTAISIAPVANQRYYDTIYQERYMGLPSDNVDGYANGSAVNYAHQLQGNLLLVHGTGDDNCHYQTTELLINELIRHKKQFSMMAYPNRTHAIREGSHTTLHLRQLMTRFLKEKMSATQVD